MLNVKELNMLLSQNSDKKLFKRWFLMTPNGTLLAYTQPTSIKDLRKQTALVSMTWRETHEARLREKVDPEGSPPLDVLRTLTVETETENLIVRLLQPQLLLVLEGGIPPSRHPREPRTVAEGPDDLPYPAEDADHDSKIAGSTVSLSGSTSSKASNTILQVQRKKLEAMATAIDEELGRSGFHMPGVGAGPKLF